MTTTQTIAQLRKTGLTVLGDMPWGTHCCHFFQTRGDLLETLVPFFKVGLESKEFCLWVVHAPLTEEQARRAIRQRIAGIWTRAASRSCRAGNGTSREAASR